MKIVYTEKGFTEQKTIEGNSITDLVSSFSPAIQEKIKNILPINNSLPAEELGLFLTFELGYKVHLIDEGAPQEAAKDIIIGEENDNCCKGFCGCSEVA